MIHRREFLEAAAHLITAPQTPNISLDLLVGDSIAEGMAPFAQIDGFEALTARGRGLAWFSALRPRMCRHLILVLGTNDLTALRTQDDAVAYVRQVDAALGRWTFQRALWATPTAFDGRNPSLERGSRVLSAALDIEAIDYADDGRISRGVVETGDGVHPTAFGYAVWWTRLFATLHRI